MDGDQLAAMAHSRASSTTSYAESVSSGTSVGSDEVRTRKYVKYKSAGSGDSTPTVASETARRHAEEFKKRTESQYSQLSHSMRERERQLLSPETLDRSTAAKYFMEQQFQNATRLLEERRARRKQLEEQLSQPGLSEEEKERLKQAMATQEAALMRVQRTKIDKNDFRIVKIIGRGGFAEVRLVQKKDTQEVFAMKILRKSDVLEWNQASHVRAERDILAQAAERNPWVTELFYSFQDADYLYLIMEYVPGGDLMSKLVQYDTFSLDVTRFYIAQIVAAVNSVHEMKYIHRDIKPDNILIDREGHIKLTDFGLCTGFADEEDNSVPDMRATTAPADLGKEASLSHLEKIFHYKKNKRSLAFSTVGSPNYIAPEVLLKSGYGQECDYWSIGIIMFEMLYGYPPFCATSDNVTYWKIVRWREYFAFPEGVPHDQDAVDLIRRLICDPQDRIQYNEIIAHPFFAGLDFDTLRDVPGPFKPQLFSSTDTSYFDQFDETAWDIEAAPSANDRQKDLPFVGYTFKRLHPDILIGRQQAPGMRR